MNTLTQEQFKKCIDGIIWCVVDFDRNSFWEKRSLEDKIDFINDVLTKDGCPRTKTYCEWSKEVDAEEAQPNQKLWDEYFDYCEKLR